MCVGCAYRGSGRCVFKGWPSRLRAPLLFGAQLALLTWRHPVFDPRNRAPIFHLLATPSRVRLLLKLCSINPPVLDV